MPPPASVRAERPSTSALAGALVALAIDLAALVSGLFGDLATLPERARDAISTIVGPLVRFELELFAATVVAGALAGLVTWALLRAGRWRGGFLRAAGGSLALLALACGRTLARRPALFDDFLWRRGGLRAQLVRLVAEGLGPRGFDLALGLVAALALGLVLWRRRDALPTLVSKRRPAFALGGLAAIALVAVPLLHRPPRYRGHAPCLVVLAADSLRADHLSAAGYPRDTTPNIDRLVAKGFFEQRMLVPIASTTASWATYLTGLYPQNHGVRDLFPRASETRMFVPTLPKLLAAKGYRTVVVSDYAGETFHRVDFGFDVVDAPPATSLDVFAQRELFQRQPLALGLFTGPLGQRLFPIARYLLDNADPALLTDRALARLDELVDDGRPFLLVVFYSATHLPFAAPMPDGVRYADRSYRGPSRYAYDLEQLSDLARVGERPGDDEVRQVRALYDGAVHAFDREVGRVERALDERGVEHVTVVTGDHGENLFEPGATTDHGKWFAGGDVAYDPPLVVAGSGIAHAASDTLASGVDFLPTMLDALHLAAPAGLDGVSLLAGPPEGRTVFGETAPWLGGKADRPPDTMPYPGVVDLLEPEPVTRALVLKRRYEQLVVRAKLRAAWRGNWKLVYTPTPTGYELALFDEAHDRFDEHDVAAAHPEVTRELAASLFRWMEGDRLRWLDPSGRLAARRER